MINRPSDLQDAQDLTLDVRFDTDIEPRRSFDLAQPGRNQ